jgi:hypothetical protein
MTGLLILSFLRLLSERDFRKKDSQAKHLRKKDHNNRRNLRNRRTTMKSAHSTMSEGNQAMGGVTRAWWQYGLETVWAAGAGVLAARPFP